jgi:hypothetical protein
MLVLTCAALVGLALDPRVITGAPAWLKPLKFAASTAIYSLSFAWLLGKLQDHPRLVRWASRTTAVALALELFLIFLQAGRGTTSHFNVGSGFDFAVFQAMGAGIAMLWVAQIAVAVALLRQRFEDPALASALRFGIGLTVLGAGVGWLMTFPSAAQLEMLRHGSLLIAGAHTVGGVDGGPGMPLTNWSLEHGDLRAAHFFGLHALQLLPLCGFFLSRMRGLGVLERARLVVVAGLGYLGLLAVLVQQALRGHPLLHIDAATQAALAAWMVFMVCGTAVALRRRRAHAAVAP